MKLRSWLSAATCANDSSPMSPQKHNVRPPKHLASEFSDGSSAASFASLSESSCSSLQSNLSLQTLPSIPSLQTLSPETLSLSVSHLCVSTIKPQRKAAPITCLALQGNEQFLYTASVNEISVYDRTSSTLLDSFKTHDSSSGSVKSVAFSGGKILTAHQDCKIRVWKLTPDKQHKLLVVLPTITDRLRHFILPKNYINVRRHVKKLWIEHADAVTGLAVNNDLIYSVSWDKSLKIWSGSDLRCLESITAHDDAVNAVAVSADGTVFTGSADRRIRVWTKPDREKRHSLVATLEKHKSAVNALALSDDGHVLFSGACDRSILVWEREDSANYMVVTGALRGHGKAILCLINVGDLLLSGSSDRTVRIWKRGLVEGKFSCLVVLDGHSKPVRSLAAESGDGVVSVYSGSLDGEIKVWQVMVSRHNSSLL